MLEDTEYSSAMQVAARVRKVLAPGFRPVGQFACPPRDRIPGRSVGK
jgi:hypothetical protein